MINKFKNHIKEINKTQKVLLGLVYGSHNYGTNSKDSDLDIIVFTVPTFEDLYTGPQAIKNYTTKVGGDDIKVTSIMKMVEMFEKANQTILETLSSKFIYVDESFKEVWEYMQTNKKELCSIDTKKVIKSMRGMGIHKLISLVREDKLKETNEGRKRQDEYGYDTKELLHAVRLFGMIEYITKYGGSFENAVDLSNITDKKSPLYGLLDELMDIRVNIPHRTKQEAYDYGISLVPPKDESYKFIRHPENEILDKLKVLIFNVVKQYVVGQK